MKKTRGRKSRVRVPLSNNLTNFFRENIHLMPTEVVLKGFQEAEAICHWTPNAQTM
jgi:hypothetical protein